MLFVLKYNVVLDIRVSSKLPEIAKKNGYKLLPGSMTVTTIQQQQKQIDISLFCHTDISHRLPSCLLQGLIRHVETSKMES